MKSYKNLVRIITIMLIIVTFFGMINIVNADPARQLGVYNGNANSGDMGGGDVEVKKIINRFIGAAQIIGVFVAVAMLIILGMKFMIASAEEKAEIKKHLTVYVIGAVSMFGAAGILEIVQKFILAATA